MSKAKARGTAFETFIVNYLQTYFPAVERRALSGTQDKGDIAGIPNMVLELKNHKAMALAQWLKEATVEMENAGVTRCAVVHKRNGVSDPALQYVTLPLYVLVDLLMS